MDTGLTAEDLSQRLYYSTKSDRKLKYASKQKETMLKPQAAPSYIVLVKRVVLFCSAAFVCCVGSQSWAASVGPAGRLMTNRIAMCPPSRPKALKR